MNKINLISIPFVLFLAWAKGRGVIRWMVVASLLGFWSLVPLLMVKEKPIKLYKIPQPIREFIALRGFKKKLSQIKYPEDIQKRI